jgi:3-hydroxybutyrate dehydrogenase
MTSLPVVVITGASAGIGECLAIQVAKTGQYRLAIVARRQAELGAVAAKCGNGTIPIVADVTVKADAERVVSEVVKAFGTVDVLVNNVGRGCFVPASQLTAEDIADMISANVNSALFCTQAVLPIFKEKKGGQVIFVNSLLGRVPELAAVRSAYVGAKHFLIGLVGSFRAEFAQEFPHIVFQNYSPGPVATDFGLIASDGKNDSRTAPNAQDPEEVAAVLLKESIEGKKLEVFSRPAYHEMVRSALAKAVPSE